MQLDAHNPIRRTTRALSAERSQDKPGSHEDHRRDQTIFRIAYRHKPYSQLGNACLQDERLSPEAGWVLMLVLSLPLNWKVNLHWIAGKRRMGRDRVRAAVKELEKFHYCQRRQQRGNRGRMGAYEYVFTDEPGSLSPETEDQAPVAPEAEAPETEPPAPVDQAPYKETKGQTKQRKQIPPAPASGGVTDIKFEEFWAAFPGRNKTGIGAVRKLFRRIVEGSHRDGYKASAQELVDGAKRYAKRQPNYPFSPKRWLNDACWLDYARSANTSRSPAQSSVAKFSYSCAEHPHEFQTWVDWAYRNQQWQRHNLWTKVGVVEVDQPFPPGHVEEAA